MFRKAWPGRQASTVLLALGTIVGCGRTNLDGFAVVQVDGDSGASRPGVADAGFDAPPQDAMGDVASAACHASTPFGVRVPVAGVNRPTGNDGTPSLSADELTMYFYSDRSGGNDIFVATRVSKTDPFGPPQPVAGVDTSGSDAWPSVTANGLSMYLESYLNGLPETFVSRRPNPAAEFPTPQLMDVENTTLTNAEPFILADQSALYFVTNAPIGSGKLDVVRAQRHLDGSFAAPTAVPAINSPFNEFSPVTTTDELVIYFGSQRPDGSAKGGIDIWRASRASREEPFGPAVDVEELNTAGEDLPSWLSPDLCRLYFTRDDGRGRKIYLAVRAM